MEKTLPLYLGSSVIGSVVCTQEDRSVVLRAKTYISLDGICRAYVKGPSGKLLIGVLAPTHSGFAVERTLTRTALSDLGLSFDGITYAYALTTSNKHTPDNIDWIRLEQLPEILCADDAIYSLANSTDALCDSNTTPTRIAVPLVTGRPFPRPDVLCLLTPCEINGEIFGVLGVSKSGAPEKI